MRTKFRVVVDTNVLISAVAFVGSIPQRALKKALLEGVLIFTKETSQEWKEVLHRPKFDRYIDKGSRIAFFFEVMTTAMMVDPKPCSYQCRDNKDQIFLEAYEGGYADYLMSGDEDLLVLKSKSLNILTPQEFLDIP